MDAHPRPARAPWWRATAICVALAALVLLVFWGVKDNDFSRDDSVYLISNANLQKGLSLEGVRWAFTSILFDNWHPLTWLSHLLDWQLFGMKPRGPHLVNVAVHALTSLLLFLLLLRATGTAWRSALVAALFAVHPLHVESVAWISERKDLLAGLFFALTLLAYLRYAHRPTLARYGAVAALFALGLMAKPMLVTLPCVLLLLDGWPLGRLARGTAKRLLLEKAPLLALSAAASVVATIAQARGGSLRSLELFPLWARTANAAVSYVAYLGKTLWPLKLAIIYPYPQEGLIRTAALSALLLAALSLVALATARRRPSLLTGWLWYLGMLVPVIGLVQVGNQPLADRYTYLPLVGLFLGGVFALPRRASLPARGQGIAGAAAAVSAVALVALLAAQARVQLRPWKNDLTLYQHAADTIAGNWEASAHVGFLLAFYGGDQEEAVRRFRSSLAVNPGSAETNLNFGVALTRWGRPQEALEYLGRAAELAPASARVRVSLAKALELAGRPAAAAAQYEEALRLEPNRTYILPMLERLRAGGGR
jgi:tetratricopeptide (TPR) repeat protein